MAKYIKRIISILIVLGVFIGLCIEAYTTYEHKWILQDNYGIVDDYKLIDSYTKNNWYCYYVWNNGDCYVVTIKDDNVIGEYQVN